MLNKDSESTKNLTVANNGTVSIKLSTKIFTKIWKIFESFAIVRTKPSSREERRVKKYGYIKINQIRIMSVPPADYRSLAVPNHEISINQYLDNSKSESCKYSTNAIKLIFNSTMDSLNALENSSEYKHLDDISMEQLPTSLCKFFMVVTKKDGVSYNASSLNTHYMSMARYLKLRDTNRCQFLQGQVCSESKKC